jgi:signal transduction histidine kinase
MPLSVGDQVIGAFSIQDIRPNTYDERSVSFLKAVASQVSIAVENARLYEQERRRAEELAALNAVAGRLGQSLELQEILDAAMDAVVGVLNVNASAISLVDEEGRTLVLCAQRGLHYSHLGMEVPLQKGLSGHVVRTGEVMITGDLNNEARLAVVDFVRERIQAMAMVPMHARGQVVGVLSAMSHRPHEFTRREIALLQAVANQVGSAVENAQLFHEVREHADELEEAYARLKEADRLKDELIQNVSHELRTPLTFIKGYVQLLVSEDMGPLTEEQRNSLDVVARKTEHLTRLVEDFITLETVREETLDVVEVSLDHLLKSAVEISRPTVLAAGIQLEEEIPSNVGVVEVDAARINQVMDNLLSNAIKFSPSGGVITVRLREEGDALRVEVADTGIGIPPDKVGRVFERFYQVDGSSRRRFSGAGLGLAIVKCIIEAHGGEVGVESSLGEGSTFYFTLPKAD